MSTPNTNIIATPRDGLPEENPVLMRAPLTVDALIAAVGMADAICQNDNGIPMSPVYSGIEQLKEEVLRPADMEETPRTLEELKERLKVEKCILLDEIEPTHIDYGKGAMEDVEFSEAMDTVLHLIFNAAYEAMAGKSPAVLEGVTEPGSIKIHTQR